MSVHISYSASALCALGFVLSTAFAFAQTYPTKPVRIINPEPGSGIDFQVRLIAPEISGALGQPLVIENRAPALMAAALAKSPPDGYTLAAGASLFWITPLIQKTSYDTLKDFAPITLITTSPFLLLVHPSLPIKSVKALIALAKARPGQLNFATATPGGGSFLSGHLFKSMSGINIVGIPYRGSALGMNALMAGEVQLMINTAATALMQAKNGKVRALAVTSGKPSALAPGLPTVAASGLPGYESAVYVGILAPGGTPEPVIDRLNQEIVRVVNSPKVKETYFNSGAEVLTGAPDHFAAKIKSEIAKWSKVIKEAGIRVE